MGYRHRTEGAIASIPKTQEKQIWGSCAGPSSFTPTGTTISHFGAGQYRFMNDSVVPHFFELRKKGFVFMNSVNAVRQVATHGNLGTLHFVGKTPTCGGPVRYQELNYENYGADPYYASVKSIPLVDGSLPPLIDLISQGEVGDMIAEVSTSVQSERGKSSFNLWEDLAELDKSLALLHDSFKTGRGIILSAKNRKRVKHASDAWLMWRYGIRPIIQDVAGILEGLKAKTGHRRFTSRGQMSRTRYSNKVYPYSDANLTGDVYEFVSDEVVVRGMSIDEADVESSFFLGLGFKNLITLPWELVKFSFVLDWFVNVGDVIGAMAPALGFKQMGSCITVKRHRSIAFGVGGFSSKTTSPWNCTMLPSGSYRYDNFSWNRSPGLPSATLKVKEDFRLTNLTRALDAYTLLMQAFG